MLFIREHKIQEVAKTKKTKNEGTKKKKTPTSNKAKPFLLIHIAKRQTIFKENVGGGQMSSANLVE